MTIPATEQPREGWPFRPAKVRADVHSTCGEHGFSVGHGQAVAWDRLEIRREGDKLVIAAMGVVSLDEPTTRAIANMMLGVADDIARDEHSFRE